MAPLRSTIALAVALQQFQRRRTRPYRQGTGISKAASRVGNQQDQQGRRRKEAHQQKSRVQASRSLPLQRQLMQWLAIPTASSAFHKAALRWSHRGRTPQDVRGSARPQGSTPLHGKQTSHRRCHLHRSNQQSPMRTRGHPRRRQPRPSQPACGAPWMSRIWRRSSGDLCAPSGSHHGGSEAR